MEINNQLNRDQNNLDCDLSESQNSEAKDSLSVRNAMSYMDLLYCQSMPYHPLYRSLQVGGILTLIIFSIITILEFNHLPPLLTLFGYAVASFLGYSLLLPLVTLISFLILRKKLEATITLTKDRIIVKTPRGIESNLEWQTVSQISKRHGAILIRIGRKPDIYYWISQSRFPDAAKAEEFYLKAKDYWESLRLSIPVDAPKVPEPLPGGKSVTCNLTLKELVVLDYYLLKPFVFLGILLYVSSLFLFLNHSLWTAPAISAVIGTLLILYPYKIAKKAFKDHPERMVAHTSISPEFFLSTGVFNGIDNRLPWTSLKKVWRWKKALLFKLESGFTIVLMGRCFESEQHFDEFSRLAIEYWQNGRVKKLVGNKSDSKFQLDEPPSDSII